MATEPEVNDPFDLSAQADAKSQQDDAARLKRQIEVDDLKWLMGHRQGRRYVWRQLQNYGVFRLSFDSDPLVMAFKEGARNHGLKLLADIHEHCPERYAEMTREVRDARRRSTSSSDRNAGNSTGS